nr:DUF5994 family protein [Mycobacterium kyorinense]
MRLRLKPAHRSCGFVQGAWWPRSTRLTAELPGLLDALSLRFGPIDRVRYHQTDWSSTPPSVDHKGGDVILDTSQDTPNVVTVFGKRVGKLALLLVPPYTEASDAYTAMTTAASAGNVSTPDRLLGISERRAKDRQQALIALNRWESEGGAQRDLPARSRPYIVEPDQKFSAGATAAAGARSEAKGRR